MFAVTSAPQVSAPAAIGAVGTRAKISSVRSVRFAQRMAVRAEPSSVERAIEEAQEVCKDPNSVESGECGTAWDVVEELSADAAHKKSAGEKKDPLDAYCEEVPDADECKVYEDV